ncbi:MAG: hypothetical protein EOO38_24550 [Cytophagaceae bacterium]|nr:MAG: hypothetical protein EOO38_24550 [Cytophagaceae bacterium]
MQLANNPNRHRPSLNLVATCIVAALATSVIAAVLSICMSPAAPAQTAAEFIEQCRQPVTSPFKENFACIHALAKDSKLYKN